MATPALRVISNSELDQQEKAKAAENAAANKPDLTGLIGYLNKQWQSYRNHAQDIHDRCLANLRAYKGQYSEEKKQAIKQFGGSEVYSNLTSVKCRSATSLLRDVFLGADKVWGVESTPVPSLPENVLTDINELVIREALTMQQKGQEVTQSEIERRRNELLDQARKAGRDTADDEAKKVEQKLQDILVEGGFYKALIDFLNDMPIFPFACIKGPIVQNSTQLQWVDNRLKLVRKPKFSWYRVSPLDLYFAPGASNTDDAGIIERIKISRTQLQNLRDLPGYNAENIDDILENYQDGWHLAQAEDGQRADLEHREHHIGNSTALLDGLEWQGPIPGTVLRQYGFTETQIPDENIDYNVNAWWIGQYVIKAHINPMPHRSNQYYVTSFEQVPGSIPGHSIPEIISDVQDVANACLRSLVNNMSIASGPQVVLNEDRISANTDPESMYPWKRWRFNSDIYGSNEKPIDFFQPNSNANELLAVYQSMANIADETSAIPRYLSGSEKVGGAARTASGLSMLINNASKMLQTVASNIDREIMEPIINDLYTIMMLTDDSGRFKGDSQIMVKGVQVATQQETDRLRRLEFLQLTANPIDSQIVGTQGRAAILREIAEDLGMPGENIVPTQEQLEAMAEKQAAQQQQQAVAGEQQQARGQQPAASGESQPSPEQAGARPVEPIEGMVSPQRV